MTKFYFVAYTRYFYEQEVLGPKRVSAGWYSVKREFTNKESAMTFIRRLSDNVLVKKNSIYLDYYFR